jgi:hypothetical protein
VCDRDFGLGKSEEVYRHFIRMESRRLEENGNAGEASGMKAPLKKTAEEERKIVDMV